MKNRLLTSLVIVLVVLDLLATFWLNYSMPLDGDLPYVVLPEGRFEPVLHDPFGWTALAQHAGHDAPNRFFAQAGTLLYWQRVPLLLQHFMSPIDSLYMARGLFVVLTQAGLLALLAAGVRRLGNPDNRLNFWLVVALLVPLFQTTGFYTQLGIIDHSITYAAFYAFALLPLLLLLLPFAEAIGRQQPLQLSVPKLLLVIALMPVVVFNGPVTPAAASLFLLLVGIYWAWSSWQRWRQGQARPLLGTGWLSGQALALLALLAVLTAYSLYLGSLNTENQVPPPLAELYERLWQGIGVYVGIQAGLPILAGLLLVNALLTKWAVVPSPGQRRILQALGWLVLFIVLYLLLLPLGGYRSYRYYLVRNDSILPILLTLLLVYGLSTAFLLSQLRGRLRGSYVVLIGLFCACFVYADRKLELPDADSNGCERWALDQLSQAKESQVTLGSGCNVLAWQPITGYEGSGVQSQLLYYWHITPEPKLYRQQ